MTTLDRLAKVRLEVNDLRNTASRALYAIDKAIEEAVPVVPAPSPEPVEPPRPLEPAPGEPITGWVLASTVEPYSRFASEEEALPYLRKVHDVVPVADNGSDPVGAFRLNEKPHLAKLLDPFFYPGRYPVNHDHTHYGYRGVDENSTHESLVRGDDWSVQLDGSAIWFPTLYARDKTTGQLRRSLNSTLIRYYKAVPDVTFWPEIAARSPAFAAWVAGMRPKTREWFEFHRLVELPDGLRFIAGVNNGTAKHILNKKVDGKQYAARNFADLLPFMEAGDSLSIEVESHPLWDGKHIDSPDHHSHLAAITHDDNNHEPIINPDFPKRLTVITLKTSHVLEDWMDLSSLAISSDLQHSKPGGTTSHAEYVEAWDKIIKGIWHREAINGHRNCSGAYLGNGYSLQFLPEIDPSVALDRFPDGPPFV